MMLAALIVAGVLATSDVVRDLGFPLPHVAPIGALVSAILVANAVFRFRLFDHDLSVSSAVYAAALAVAGVAAYLGVFRVLGGNVVALALGTVTVTLGLCIAVYEMSTSAAVQRARVERLLALGRFSSQMAHDLKNPLASLKGALQFLEEERRRGRSLDDQNEFLTLMLDQVERLGRVADEYERIGRVEPVRHSVDLNRIVQRVVGLEPFAAKGRVAIRTELAPELPTCDLDADLVARALENLIQNALEAMPEGGKVTVRTASSGGGRGGASRVIVSDVTPHMQVRLLRISKAPRWTLRARAPRRKPSRRRCHERGATAPSPRASWASAVAASTTSSTSWGSHRHCVRIRDRNRHSSRSPPC
jgi:signal transduction histidine kinase